MSPLERRSELWPSFILKINDELKFSHTTQQLAPKLQLFCVPSFQNLWNTIPEQPFYPKLSLFWKFCGAPIRTPQKFTPDPTFDCLLTLFCLFWGPPWSNICKTTPDQALCYMPTPVWRFCGKWIRIFWQMTIDRPFRHMPPQVWTFCAPPLPKMTPNWHYYHKMTLVCTFEWLCLWILWMRHHRGPITWGIHHHQGPINTQSN